MSASNNEVTDQYLGPTQQALANHPKKKGGFVITSVKDNVDGDESADDLDESHTSYSDISYSRTTDADHDPESSASEDTLNMTLENTLAGTAVQPGYIVAAGLHDKSNVSKTSFQGSAALHEMEVKKLKPGGNFINKDSNLDNITENAISSQVPLSLSTNGNQSSAVKNSNEKAIPNHQIPQSSASTQVLKPATLQGKAPVLNKMVTAVSSVLTSTVITTTSTATKPTTSTSGPSKGGASRVYKVVKREALLPTKRVKKRWTLYDYVDTQTPHLDFIVQSVSDSRLNFQDSSHHLYQHTPTLPFSISTTSVPSSSSSYNLHHSDSNSSVFRDPNNLPVAMQHGVIGMSGNLANNQVQHSTSVSSVTHELDNRLLQNIIVTQSINENLEDLNRRKSMDERLQDAEHDSIKNAIQSYADLTAKGAESTSEDETYPPSFNNLSLTLLASSRSVRIDNKIEAAMDLVKKHLMLAVRDEVDELKEQIVELKMENESLKGVLTNEQIHQVQNNLQRQKTPGSSQSSLFQPQPSGTGSVLNYPIQGLPEGTNSQMYHQNISQKQSHAIPNIPQSQTPQNFVKQPSMVNQPQPYMQPPQSKPVNLGVNKPVKPQALLIQSPIQQPLTAVPQQQQQQQQQIIQQQQLHGQSSGSIQSKVGNWPQNQQMYHPNIQNQQQPQLTPQQIQGLRQQAYQHQTNIAQNPGTVPQGYQQPSVSFQQPQASTYNPVGYQPQQPTSHPITQSQPIFQPQQTTRQHPAANITSPTSSNPAGHQIANYQVQPQQIIPPQIPTTTISRHSAPIPSAGQAQASHNGQLSDHWPPHS